MKYLLRVRKEKVEIEATVGVIQGNNLGTILYIYILYIYISYPSSNHHVRQTQGKNPGLVKKWKVPGNFV